jgi:hypothetical protein
MGFLRLLGRAYLADRLLGRPRQGYGGYGRSPYCSNRQRRRGGFVGPFPYYSGRTRRGTRVTVGGCCLPIPLGVLTVSALGLRLLTRR